MQKTYHVKVLDFSYQVNFEHLEFRYLHYVVDAMYREEAIKKARSLYMSGEKELFSEEIPFLLKLFSIDNREK